MKVEIRSGHVLLDGYVNAVGRDSRAIPDRRGAFVEQVVPGAFAKALGKGGPVSLLLNHDQRRALGSTATGELKLFEDNIGLRAQAKITDAEIIEKAKAKKLRGWSFGFRNAKDSWEERDGAPPRRYLEDFELREVTIVDDRKIPAYPATSLELRGGAEEMVEYRMSDDEPEYQEGEESGGEGGGSGGKPDEERASGANTLIAGYKARRLRIVNKKGQ